MTKTRSAFTMIELVIVMAIIGILSAVMLPKISSSRSKAKSVKVVNDLATCIVDSSGPYFMRKQFDLTSIACQSARTCFSITPNNTMGTLTVANSGTAPECARAHLDAVAHNMSQATFEF